MHHIKNQQPLATLTSSGSACVPCIQSLMQSGETCGQSADLASSGAISRTQVRRLAAEAGLANQGRRDSQGICFLGKVKFTEFVRQHLGEWCGLIVEEETEQAVGMHDGFWFYTVGQRGGIGLGGGPW